RIKPTPTVPEIDMVAGWKRKELLDNQGIAVVAIGQNTNHPGEFARAICPRIGKRVGYVPLLYRLRLKLVITGRRILDRATELQWYLDTAMSFTVFLQSLHVLDLEAAEFLRDVPGDVREVRESFTTFDQQWAEGIVSYGANREIKYAPMEAGFACSPRTGRAVRSAWGWREAPPGPYTDSLTRGIRTFLITPLTRDAQQGEQA